jgi:DNA-binding response OmpR family regulator
MSKLIDVSGKILVADDEKTNADFFQVMLTKLGFRVEVAYDGEETLQKVHKFLPDIILLDLLMPKLSGYHVIEILKNDEETKHIPIIVLTAVNDIKNKVDMIELGIEDYITKPFNFVEILARIRSNLRSKFLKEEISKKEQKLHAVEKLEESVKDFLEHTEGCTQTISCSFDTLKLPSADSENHDTVVKIKDLCEKLLKNVHDLREAYEVFSKKS